MYIKMDKVMSKLLKYGMFFKTKNGFEIEGYSVKSYNKFMKIWNGLTMDEQMYIANYLGVLG